MSERSPDYIAGLKRGAEIARDEEREWRETASIRETRNGRLLATGAYAAAFIISSAIEREAGD